MKISILEKSRAPSRFLVYKGLELGDGDQLGTSRRLTAEEVVPAPDDQEQADARQDDVADLVAIFLAETARDQVADDETCTQHGEIHLKPPQGTVFSMVKLPERLSVSCDSDDVANIAYIRLKVKPNRKSPYFRAFSRILYWIKKFSFPRIKMWFVPMFFSGFFCGFERCGSAAFRIFRGGISQTVRKS